MFVYLKNIHETVTSVFEGMTITFSHLFRKPVTVQYPDRTAVPVVQTLPGRFRGFLKVDMELCTACLACMNDCPIDCIKIVADRNHQTKQRYMTRFDIDLSKCMYCSLCTEPCPTGAIHFTREFERATESPEELVFRFIPAGQVVEPYKLPRKEKPPVTVPAGQSVEKEKQEP